MKAKEEFLASQGSSEPLRSLGCGGSQARREMWGEEVGKGLGAENHISSMWQG